MARKKYSVETVKSDLDLDEDLDMQETAWKMQKVGMTLLFLLVVLAAFGVFGNGIASTKMIKTPNSEVEYERFFRHEAKMELKIKLNNTDSVATVSLPNSYLDNFHIESIFPEPKENIVTSDQVQYTFKGSNNMNIVFYLSPIKTGTVRGNLKVNNVDHTLKHFIYP